MKLKVDCSKCCGCQSCILSYPEYVREELGSIEIIKQPETEEKAQELKDVCPMGAIEEVKDETVELNN